MQLRKIYDVSVEMEDGTERTIRVFGRLSKTEEAEMKPLVDKYELFEKELVSVQEQLHIVDGEIAILEGTKTKGKTDAAIKKELQGLHKQKEELLNFDFKKGELIVEEVAKKRFEVSVIDGESKSFILKALDGSGLFNDFMLRLSNDLGELERKK